MGKLKKRKATWTYSGEHGHLYYFAPKKRRPPPYLKQVIVEAILDIADDGTLAGVEIVDTKAPPPPSH